MAFPAAGFCACTDESEELLPMVGAEDVLVNKDAITELRSLRPTDSDAERPIITNPGQKGRDHRDGHEDHVRVPRQGPQAPGARSPRDKIRVRMLLHRGSEGMRIPRSNPVRSH